MISKQIFLILIFFAFLLLTSNGKRRAVGVRSRSSSSNSSNNSSSTSTGKIIGIILLVIPIVSAMIYKIWKYFRNQKRRERVEEQMAYFNYIYENNFQIFIIDQINKTDLPSEKTKRSCFILIPTSIQSFDDVSKELIDANKIEESATSNSDCRSQIINKEKECSLVTPVKNTHV